MGVLPNLRSRLEARAPMSASSDSSIFPQRSIVLAGICPPGVVAVEFSGLADASKLYPQERDETTTFGEKRRSEFSAGRLCAKHALAQFGIVNFPLQINDDRRPRWPDGIVGSISHTLDYCAALVVRASDASAIGFDVERTERIGEDLWDLLFTPREQERLRDLPLARRAVGATIVFSAKEAFYKCHFASSPTWLDFTDVEIDVSPGLRGTESATFNIHPRTACVVRARYVGRFVVANGFVATSVVIPTHATLTLQ
jgi:4'-phosphopantetheinyl transferase EntD